MRAHHRPSFENQVLRADLYLPSELIPTEAVIIPKLPHGSNMVEVRTGTESLLNCDALVTTNRALAIGLRTADCAPICFGDGVTIGIAHIGWRGLCTDLIENMLPQFSAQNLTIYTGPFLPFFGINRDSCYEQITAKFGTRFFTEDEEQITFHFEDAIRSLLPATAIFDVRTTATDLSLPSYRRDHTSERLTTTVQFA